MGAGDPGEAAARRQAARARAPLGRASGAHHAEQRVAHRTVARARRHPAGVAGERSSAPSLVFCFMLLYYRKSRHRGANVAVLFNLMLQLAVLASFGATMTLPGIAGLALTIGMGIDANVLINERIREELRAGKTVRSAVGAGYTRAWPSIVDGHITVFISGLILAQYGTRPGEGLRRHAHRRHHLQPLHGRLLHAPRLRLVGARREGQTPQRRSGVLGHGVLQAGTRLRLHGPAALLDPAELHPGHRLRSSSRFYPGPNYGTDFQGGTEVEIAFTKPVDARRHPQGGRGVRLPDARTSCRSSTRTTRTTSSSACRT